MVLSISKRDTDILLEDKNVLKDSILDKYRVAGQVTQTALRFIMNLINDSYHRKTCDILSINQLCLLTDSFISSCLESQFKYKVSEKGISYPTSIDIDEVCNNWSPELDDSVNVPNWNKDHQDSDDIHCNGCSRSISGYFQPGDSIKITLGCHIDGYTSQVSHTMVIYPTTTNSDGDIVPVNPLVGNKADAIAATHIAMETVIYLISCSLTPEKLPPQFKHFSNGNINGRLLRAVVDMIASTYNCVVVPGSKIRRIRRFLAGQNEGIVAEKDIKSVIWTESHQESSLLSKVSDETSLVNTSIKDDSFNNVSAIATDEFLIFPGEAYLVDLKFAPVFGYPKGLVTLQNVDHFSGKSHKNDLVARSNIIVRDFGKSHILKLKSSRKLLTKIDQHGVYPLKLSHLSNTFPLDLENPDYNLLKKDLTSMRLGLSEITNNYLACERPVQITKLIPWDIILKASNPSGKLGLDALDHTVLPGYELPLPKLGLSSLKVKSLLKHAISVPVIRECTTVVLCNSDVTGTGKPELLKLSGGSTTKPSWVHSKYSLDSNNSLVQGIFQLAQLSKDKRFGLSIRETQPWKVKLFNPSTDAMME